MASEMTVGSNVEIVREYTRRVFNEHNPDLASEYLTPDVKWHGGTLGTVEGLGNVVGLLRGFIGALPDLNAQEQDIVAEGDTVAVRFVVEATHQVSCSASRQRVAGCAGTRSMCIACGTERSARSGPPTT